MAGDMVPALITPAWPGESGGAPAPSLVNYEAEQGLLGQLLVNNACFDQVADFLEPKHFGDPAHGRIFEAIRSFIIQGRQADPRTLKPFFEADKDLSAAGGWQYLVKLHVSVTVMVDPAEYGRRIFDDWRRRRLDTLGDTLKAGAHDLRLDRDVGDVLAEAEAGLWELDREGRVGSGGLEDAAAGVDRYLDLAERAYKADGALIGLSTGLRGLDEALGGLHAGDLVVVAGRPGMGKSALALNIARAAAEAERTVAFFSLEMPQEQLMGRLLAERTGVTTERVRRGQVRQEEMQILLAAAAWARALPIKIDATSNIAIAQLRSRCRKLQRRGNLGLIVVDYLQLMRGEGENRVQEITDISSGLKAVAKDLGVPVLACAQLSRQVEMREDKRPQLSDLRESGSIEQDADSVLFLYREEYYAAKEEPKRRKDEDDGKFTSRQADWQAHLADVAGKAEIIVGKNRHGPERVVEALWNGPRQRFSDKGSDNRDGRQGTMLAAQNGEEN